MFSKPKTYLSNRQTNHALSQTPSHPRRPLRLPLHLKLHPLRPRLPPTPYALPLRPLRTPPLPPPHHKDLPPRPRQGPHRHPPRRRPRPAPLKMQNHPPPPRHPPPLCLASQPSRGSQARKRRRPTPHRPRAGIFVLHIPDPGEHLRACRPRGCVAVVHRDVESLV